MIGGRDIDHYISTPYFITASIGRALTFICAGLYPSVLKMSINSYNAECRPTQRYKMVKCRSKVLSSIFLYIVMFLLCFAHYFMIWKHIRSLFIRSAWPVALYSLFVQNTEKIQVPLVSGLGNNPEWLMHNPDTHTIISIILIINFKFKANYESSILRISPGRGRGVSED